MTVQYWHKGRHIDQWNKIEGPEINLHIYNQLIKIQVSRPFNEEKIIFNKWC